MYDIVHTMISNQLVKTKASNIAIIFSILSKILDLRLSKIIYDI